jgi:hypothetical protein
MRYLSNEEKIRLVFEHQNNGTTITIIDDNDRIHKYEKIKYSNFEEFVQENPNCCKINPTRSDEPLPEDFLDRITGFNSGYLIVLNFKTHYLGSSEFKVIKAANEKGKLKV